MRDAETRPRADRWTRRSKVALTAVVVVASFGLGMPVAEAATLCVDPAGTPACYATVQAAVTAAAPGDTVDVVAGAFDEDVTIAKALTLRGTRAGVDARTRTGTETTLRSVLVTAGDVTVDGFTFSSNATTQFRITGGPAVLSGVRVENDVFTNYANVAIIPDTAGNIVIRHNSFHSPSGLAEPMQLKDNFAAGGCDGAQILDNRFVGATTNGGADVNLSCNHNGGATGITVSGNASSGNEGDTNDGSLVAAAGVDSLTVTGNTAATQGTPVYFWGQVAGAVTVSSNDLTSANGSAVSITKNFGTSSGTFTITGNALAGNPKGVNVATDALAGGTVDATGNWWGSITGPTVTGNPSGTGSAIGGTATWSPWCTTSTCASRSDDASLTALSLSDGTLSPAFASGTTAYTASVASGVTAVSVTATPATGATAVVSGASSLAAGANTVTVTTTSYDGSAHRTYTVTVTRATAAPAPPAPTTTTPPPTTTPPVSVPPVTAPPNSSAPVSAPAKPGQSGSAVVDVPKPAAPPDGRGDTPALTPPPVKVAVAWPATAFKEPVTVMVTPVAKSTPPTTGGGQDSGSPSTPGAPVGAPATGPTAPAPPVAVGGGLSLGAGNAVVSLNVTNEAGAAVTRFEAPLEIRISGSDASEVPAYSRDGTTWTTIPRLASLPIPADQDDGYFVNADGSVSIFTRHATLFGLLTDAESPKVAAFGAILSGDHRTLRFVWRAGDNVGVTSVVLALDGALLGAYPASVPDVTLPRRDGNYTFAAVDGAGNVSKDGPVTVRGPVVVRDTTPPTPPHLVARISGRTLRLRWTGSRDATAVTYAVYRNGRLLRSEAGQSVTVPVAEGVFTVDAIDQPGHRATSNRIRVTRPSVHGRPWRAWPA